MEEPTLIPPIPSSGEPRHCPRCGSRVADLASDCLMCGASLDVGEELPEEEPARRPRLQIPWRNIITAIFVVTVFLILLWLLVRSQISGYSATPTPVYMPTATHTPTSTPTPVDTPEPSLTPTPIPPLAHQVKQGETCVGIAVQYDITLEALSALNPEKCPDGIIIPGDVLLIPVAPPTPGPGTPTLTPQCPIYYAVQDGDTGIGIARKFNVAFGVLQAANPDKDLSQLQVNHVVIVPCGTPAPTAAPTPDPNAAPTPIPKYAPPALLSPPDGAVLTGDVVPLQWTAVSLLREDERYAVRLRRLDIDAPVQNFYTRMTLFRLDEAYAPTPDDPVREYRWWVIVERESVDDSGGAPDAASLTSEKRTFRWIAPTPEPTRDSIPTP